MNGRSDNVQIITTLTQAPGDCALCRRTRATEYLDTGIDYRKGRLYLCKDEFTPKQWDALKANFDGPISRTLRKSLDSEVFLYNKFAEEANKPTFACPQCPDKVFDSQNALNGHITSHKKRGDWKGEQ
jgi:hypothetical protein